MVLRLSSVGDSRKGSQTFTPPVFSFLANKCLRNLTGFLHGSFIQKTTLACLANSFA